MFVVKSLFCQMLLFPKSRHCLAADIRPYLKCSICQIANRKSIEGGVGQQLKSYFNGKTCSWSFELLLAKAGWVGVQGSKSRKPWIVQQLNFVCSTQRGEPVLSKEVASTVLRHGQPYSPCPLLFLIHLRQGKNIQYTTFVNTQFIISK